MGADRCTGMSETEMPALAPPGAGLPVFQRLVAKYWLLPRFFRDHPWAGLPGQFAASGARVLESYARIPEHERARRVLVPSIRGLEDSSRFWSAAMVLEHLVIAGELITGGVELLAAGKVPEGEASIAAIKPPGAKSPAEAEAAYREFLPRGEARLRGAVGTTSTLAFSHPWFGPLTAHQWACFPILHDSIHRQQLKEIGKGLG